MKSFENIDVKSVGQAVSLLQKFQQEKKQVLVVGGGSEALQLVKDDVLAPDYVINLKTIPGLNTIKEERGGFRIGALTTLADVEDHPGVRDKLLILSTAAGEAASPQIRNAGTIGGNVAQDARCWYYRYGLPCYRAGGNTCFADTPAGMNREHALFEASRCVAVSPSDTAPALVALEAKMVIKNSKGERVVDAENFFLLPAADITRMTVLEAGDILTAIRLPAKWAGAKFYFEKVADRNTWDFALVNIAAVKLMDGDTVKDIRIAAGGVQNTPKRLKVVEDTVKGQKITPELAQLAGTAATRGARPLNYNHFKVPLLTNLVSRALRAA